MKIEFINRGAATRLILIFAGWSTDARYYNDCVADGWDTAVISDYSDLSIPELPKQYTTVYIFAYSLGVWAASLCQIESAARIAICGSEMPVSDKFGIPVAIFNATADGLTVDSLQKFHRRMAGDRATFNRIEPLLPSSPDIDDLKDELHAIAAFQDSCKPVDKWDRAYIAKHDRIFPEDNLYQFWSCRPDTVLIALDSSHAVDIAQIIKDNIPNPSAIRDGFSHAVATYNVNAIVQAEICKRIGEIIEKKSSEMHSTAGSVLEIGVGRGLLTDIWSSILNPTRVVFIDLLPMPEFGIAEDEEYIIADAEEWLKNSTEKFDIILSASTIQWFADPICFIKTVKDHLNPGGFAVISTFQKGNLHQLDAIRPCPIIYRTSSEYSDIPGIWIEEWERTLSFPSSRAMMMHLRLTGVTPQKNKDIDTKTSGSPAYQVKFSDLPNELTYRPMIMVIADIEDY